MSSFWPCLPQSGKDYTGDPDRKMGELLMKALRDQLDKEMMQANEVFITPASARYVEDHVR